MRISWPMFARNSDFTAAARSASARAAASFSVSSICSVTSRITSTNTWVPSSSRTRAGLLSSHSIRPSLRVER